MRARLTVASLGRRSPRSLTYSVVLTATNQPLAYFHSLTRLWEFALGGLLALTIDGGPAAPPDPGRGWAGSGWSGCVACGAVLRVGTVFPGFAALWPTGLRRAGAARRAHRVPRAARTGC